MLEAMNKNFCGSNSAILNYDNLVDVGSDGANVMMGRKNSVLSRLKTYWLSLQLPFSGAHSKSCL